jgi:hypothetical protein
MLAWTTIYLTKHIHGIRDALQTDISRAFLPT